MPMKLIRSSMRPGQSGLVHRGVFETIHYHPILRTTLEPLEDRLGWRLGVYFRGPSNYEQSYNGWNNI